MVNGVELSPAANERLKLRSEVELNIGESFLRHFEYPGGFGEEDRLVVSIIGDVFFLSGDESFESFFLFCFDPAGFVDA